MSAPPPAAAAAPHIPASDLTCVQHLIPLITHLDVLSYEWNPKPGGAAPYRLPKRLLDLFAVKGKKSEGGFVLAKATKAVVEDRHVGQLAATCDALCSKEAAMDVLGFGPRVATTVQRVAGQHGGSGDRAAKDIVADLEERYRKQRAASQARLAQLAQSPGPAPRLCDYPLTIEQAREALVLANRDGHAPGVGHELALPENKLSTLGEAKLSQLASTCVCFKGDGETVPLLRQPHDQAAGLPVLPPLQVNMDEFELAIKAAYASSDKGKQATTSSLKPPQEALLWSLFTLPVSASWALHYNATQDEGAELTLNRSANVPNAARAQAVAAFNAVRQDPAPVVDGLMNVLMKVGADNYRGTLVPAEHCESEDSLRGFFTEAALNIYGISEACITSAVTARAGPLSTPLQNYAASGDDGEKPCTSFVTNEVGIERVMHLVIMYCLIEQGGGINLHDGRLWRVVLRVNDIYTANPDPDQLPMQAPRDALLADKKGGKRGSKREVKRGGEGEEGDEPPEERAKRVKLESEAYIAACSAVTARHGAVAGSRLADVSRAIGRLIDVQQRDGSLTPSQSERLLELRELEEELMAKEDEKLIGAPSSSEASMSS